MRRIMGRRQMLSGLLTGGCLLLLLCLLTVRAAAADAEIVASGYCGGEGDGTNLIWTLDSEGTLTISGQGKMADYDSFSNQPWYSYRYSLKALVIESGVTSIGNDAFYWCSCFTGDLVIPDGVTTIGDCAFQYCWSFRGSLVIPDGVTRIGEAAFSHCAGFTGSLTIPDSVTSIGNSAFEGCSSFTGRVEIPATVTLIGDGAFAATGGITAIEVSERNSNYTSVCGVLFDKDTMDLIVAPGGLAKEFSEYHVPATVKCVKDDAFSGFTGNIYFLGDAPKVGRDSFGNSNSFVVLYYNPDTTGWIDSENYDAASRTWNGYVLRPVGTEILDRGTCGGEGDGTNLAWTLDGRRTLTISGQGTMADYGYDTQPWYRYRSYMKSLVIEDGVTTIGALAFCNCKGFTGDLIIPNSVTTIGDGAFGACSGFTGDLIIPNSVTTIGDNALGWCHGFTGSLVLPNNLTSIGDGAFWNCDGLTGSLTLPDSLTSIGEQAFCNCSGLSGTLTIPASVSNIGGGAFNRTLLHIEVAPENSCFTVVDGVLFDKAVTKLISVPHSVSGEYSIPDTVITIDNYAFWLCSDLTGNLIIPNSVSNIGNEAFYNCTNFTGLTIGNSVTSIGVYAFQGCSGLSGNIYFCGDAPTVYAASNYNGSFDTGSVLYYLPGTSGWTDSSYYDADAGTWNGYALRIWGTATAVKTEDGICVFDFPEETQQVAAAFYDANGRMTDVQMVSCTTAANGSVTFTIPESWDSGTGSWKILLLDGDLAPVAAAINT